MNEPYVVVSVRARDGNSVPADSIGKPGCFIRSRFARETVVRADEASSWDNSHERFAVERIGGQAAYSFDGARPDMAAHYFSRVTRAEAGIFRDDASAYLRHTQEPAGPAALTSRECAPPLIQRQCGSCLPVCRVR
jgi:hypothetical protein